MLIKKITPGYVIQVFDTDTKQCIQQCFNATDGVEYEDIDGNLLTMTKPYLLTDTKPYYCHFDMIQPPLPDDILGF
jgi:hypothetical protein